MTTYDLYFRANLVARGLIDGTDIRREKKKVTDQYPDAVESDFIVVPFNKPIALPNTNA
jgi:hypothetical protein